MLIGCWDAINLEDRGFIIGTAIDLEESENDQEATYQITNQLVIPTGTSSSSQGISGNEKPFLNITSRGKSIYNTNEELSTKSSKVPFFEHLMILIVSEEVAKEKHLFSNLLDTFLRDVKIRRGIKIIVSKDEAKTILDFTTPEEILPAIHLDDLLERSSKELGYSKPLVLGDLEEYHLRGRSYLLPLLEVSETLNYKSGAVFQGSKDQMVGVFNQDEMQGYELLASNPIENVIEFTHEDKVYAFEINDIKNKIAINPSDINNIKATININVTGGIKEAYGKENLLSSNLYAIEKAVSNKIKESIESAINKGQKELNADVFNFWQKLESKNYDTWEKIKDDWEDGENYFANTTFDIYVNTDIYSIGTSNKTD